MDIKQSIRARHKLDDNADVRIITSTVSLNELEESDPYKFTARITTDAVDRQDEVVIPQGGDVNEFMESGVIAWNHNYDSPVGFPNKGKRVVRGENFIECGGVFMKRPPDFVGDFFPDFCRAFVTQASMANINPGVSIGFLPIESRRPSKADVERYGKRVQVVHSKWKLLEFSIAPVQANQEAVVTAIGKGLMKREVAKAIGMDIPDVPAPVEKCEPQVLREILFIRETSHMSISEMVRREVRNAFLKQFGRLYE